MSTWTKAKLGDIARPDRTGIVDGPFGSNLPASAYQTFGIPVIRGTNLSLGQERFRDTDFVFVSKDTANRLSRSLCHYGDIIFTKKGTLGQTGIVPLLDKYKVFLISSNQMKLSVDRNIANPLFVYYYVSSPSSRDRILLDAMTTGVPKINLGYLRKFPISIPPLPVQRKIAAVLSAYDDLIENNTRRIALLEKMAEEIYREWFVRLRFPGHEQVTFHKGIPEGWGVKRIEAFCQEVQSGVKIKDIEGSTRYLGLEHLPRKSILVRDSSTIDSVQSNKLLFMERDILFGKIRPYLHKVALADFSGACSSDTIVIRPKHRYCEGFLLFTIFSDTFIELATISSKGTKMPRADWDFLKKLEIVLPSQKILKEYQAEFEMHFSLMSNLSRVNEALKQTRDRLLTRLISGKLSVEDLDIQFPPSMKDDASDSQS